MRRAAYAGATLALLALSGCPILDGNRSCGYWSSATVFRASGECGPGGLVVVEVGGGAQRLRVWNGGRALGLPTSAPGDLIEGVYDEMTCPPEIEQGGWAFGSTGRKLDGGSDAGEPARDAAASPAPVGFTCRAALEQGVLILTCDVMGNSCRSVLEATP